jgi:adenosylhomocysteine nucleosidase
VRECPAIIAALPREVRALVKGWERREVAANVWVWTKGNAVVACAGMGAARAAIAVDAARAAMPVTAVVSAGVAGACEPKLRTGDIVQASVVIDSGTGERFQSGVDGQVLVTVGAVAGVREKARLLAEYGAAAVEMEAATVARMAREHGLAFRAIKAISDEAEFEMEALTLFSTGDGQFREGAFAVCAAIRPWMWGSVIALGRSTSVALAALTKELRDTLDWYGKDE